MNNIIKKIKSFTNSKYYDGILDLLLCLGLLVQDIYKLVLFNTPFYKYVIVLIFVLLFIDFIINKRKIKLSLYYLLIIIVLYIYTFLLSYNKNIIVPAVFFLVEVITYILYIERIKEKEDFRKRLFNIIFFVATVLSAIGIIQVISYNLNISFIYKNITQFVFYLDEGRLTSIYSEPAHLCTILGAGIFISCYYLTLTNKFRYYLFLLLFLITGLLSKSIVTYASIFGFVILACYYIFRNYKKIKYSKKIISILLIIIAVSTGFVFFSSNSSYLSVITSKITSLNEGKFGENRQKSEKKSASKDKEENNKKKSNTKTESNLTNQSNNMSAFAIKSNLNICIEKLKDKYYFGTGIFSHMNYYDKYMKRIYTGEYLRVNYTDACSMFLRIFSEFGIVGFIIYLAMLIYLLIKSIIKNDIVLLTVLMLFITQSMRLGDYNWYLNCFTFVYLLFNVKPLCKHVICIGGGSLCIKKEY